MVSVLLGRLRAPLRIALLYAFAGALCPATEPVRETPACFQISEGLAPQQAQSSVGRAGVFETAEADMNALIVPVRRA
jgi:hypothetical protein